jgi:hypothetical protein
MRAILRRRSRRRMPGWDLSLYEDVRREHTNGRRCPRGLGKLNRLVSEPRCEWNVPSPAVRFESQSRPLDRKSRFHVGRSRFQVESSRSSRTGVDFHAGRSRFQVEGSRSSRTGVDFQVESSRSSRTGVDFHAGRSRSSRTGIDFHAGRSRSSGTGVDFHAGRSRSLAMTTRFFTVETRFHRSRSCCRPRECQGPTMPAGPHPKPSGLPAIPSALPAVPSRSSDDPSSPLAAYLRGHLVNY